MHRNPEKIAADAVQDIADCLFFDTTLQIVSANLSAQPLVSYHILEETRDTPQIVPAQQTDLHPQTRVHPDWDIIAGIKCL